MCESSVRQQAQGRSLWGALLHRHRPCTCRVGSVVHRAGLPQNAQTALEHQQADAGADQQIGDRAASPCHQESRQDHPQVGEGVFGCRAEQPALAPRCKQKRRLRGACFPEMPARSSGYFMPSLPLQRQQAAQTSESPKLYRLRSVLNRPVTRPFALFQSVRFCGHQWPGRYAPCMMVTGESAGSVATGAGERQFGKSHWTAAGR